MISDYVKNNSSLHELQFAEYKNQGKNPPIGLVKFIDKCHINELAEYNVIYFSNVKDFKEKDEKNEDVRKDNEEGKYYFKNRKKVSLEDITKECQAQTYITSFTLLFEEDFDKDGKIKQNKINLLKRHESGKESRPFVTINFSNFISNVKKIEVNTPRLVNKHLPSPKVKGLSNISEIYGGYKEEKEICDWIDSLKHIEQDVKDEAKKQLTSCRDIDNTVWEALRNTGCIKSEKNADKKELEAFTIHGGYVYYNDHFDPFTEKAKFIYDDDNNCEFNRLTPNEKHSFYEKLIECCIALKRERYAEETEYRLLISNFFFNKELNGIELNLDQIFNFNYKKHEYEDLDNLKREDFKDLTNILKDQI